MLKMMQVGSRDPDYNHLLMSLRQAIVTVIRKVLGVIVDKTVTKLFYSDKMQLV